MKSAEFREQKAGQRAARKQVEELFTAVVKTRQPWLKGSKLRQAVKVMTDRYYADIVRPAAEKISRSLSVGV